jgi:hypothetical protein
VSEDHRHFIDALRGFLRLSPLYYNPPSVSPWTVPTDNGNRHTPCRVGWESRRGEGKSRNSYYEERLFVARNSRANHRM